jgi:DNA transformation protein and related proteins
MATSKETIDYFLRQTAGAGNMRAQRMFGEFALYCENKVVGLVCDDQLFIKITPIANKYLDDSHNGHPYPGSKPWRIVPEEKWEDRQWLAEFITETAKFVEVKKPRLR